MTGYRPQQLEEKWVKKWEEEKVYKTIDRQKRKKKVYVLPMFPYPSGSGLHVGHVRIYTGTDVLARYFRMKGYAVLHPMGWDAFGLPAENAAIKAKKNPIDMVPKNIGNFKRQMKRLGLSYDWSRELATTDPNYYGFTQWLLLQFFKMGLLYKKLTPVYFCPNCQTGLAEEEVLPNGLHERCGKPITKKLLPQWIFKITDYADSLLDTLDGLDWPRGILEMQRNWIGKKRGTEIKFKVFCPFLGKKDFSRWRTIKVFTTRVDTIFGVTALVLAPEHWLVEEILAREEFDQGRKKEIKDYVKEAEKKLNLVRTDLTKEKTGVFSGCYAIHPLTGEKIPIWIGDYVLSFYGQGAVMVVPAHDERDYQFALRYNLPIKPVVKKKSGKTKLPFVEYGVLINSGRFSGMDSQKAMREITRYLQNKGLGKGKKEYKLRDWVFSRQRYWGEPIPLLHCKRCADSKISFFKTEGFIDWKNKLRNLNKNHHNTTKLYQKIERRVKKIEDSLYGWFPIKEEELPLKLPYIKSYKPTKTGKSPLEEVKDWWKTTCPYCGGEAKRETDTMPNWAGSCWYFLAFVFWKKDVNVKSRLFNSSYPQQTLSSPFLTKWRGEKENFKGWLPVDWYLGGAEHAVLHLLYARFWIHALNDLGLVEFREPFFRLRNVGMILAEDHRKMSKSLGNVINPDQVVDQWGGDVLRVYEMFIAPFSQEIAWSNKALRGISRFLNKIWQTYNNSDYLTNIKNKEDKDLVIKLQITIDKVSRDITDVKFNTAIAAMMEFINQWNDKRTGVRQLTVHQAKKFLQILAPFAPFITEEIWRNVFKEKKSIHLSKWPEVDKDLLKEKTTVITLPVQVNGKLRTTLELSPLEIDKETVVNKALKEERVNKWLSGKRYRVVYIRGKILNFVVK